MAPNPCSGLSSDNLPLPLQAVVPDSVLFASRHRDENPVACIEDSCLVLSEAEFFRFWTEKTRRMQQRVPRRTPTVSDSGRSERWLRAFDGSVDVFVCCGIYDFKLKRVLKNPQYVHLHQQHPLRMHHYRRGGTGGKPAAGKEREGEKATAGTTPVASVQPFRHEAEHSKVGGEEERV